MDWDWPFLYSNISGAHSYERANVARRSFKGPGEDIDQKEETKTVKMAFQA